VDVPRPSGSRERSLLEWDARSGLDLDESIGERVAERGDRTLSGAVAGPDPVDLQSLQLLDHAAQLVLILVEKMESAENERERSSGELRRPSRHLDDAGVGAPGDQNRSICTVQQECLLGDPSADRPDRACPRHDVDRVLDGSQLDASLLQSTEATADRRGHVDAKAFVED